MAPVGHQPVHRWRTVKREFVSGELSSLLHSPRRTSRRGSGGRYPLRAHRVYGAGAPEHWLKSCLLHHASLSFCPLPLGSLRTSGPIGARSAKISEGGPCERAWSSRAVIASLQDAGEYGRGTCLASWSNEPRTCGPRGL